VVNLYSEVAKIVANEINVKLTPQINDLLSKAHPVNPEAYELYIKGRISLALLTPKGIDIAEKYFLKSVEIDPQFAPAFGGLAGIWIVKKQLNGAPPEEADPKMEEYLTKAFELDSTDAEVWRWQASKLANTDYDWRASNSAYEKCLKLNPNFSEARAFYAHSLMIQNRWDEAWEQMNRAVELDPFNPLIQGFRGIMLVQQGRYDEYLSLDISALGNTGLLVSYSRTKQYDKAVEQLKVIIKRRGQEEVIKILEETYESTGFNAAFNATADTLAKISDSPHPWTGRIMILYHLAENKEKSLYWLEKMYIRRNPNLPYYAIINSSTRAYQKEPRYIEIMERINLR
jgi:adenylate cyclase